MRSIQRTQQIILVIIFVLSVLFCLFISLPSLRVRAQPIPGLQFLSGYMFAQPARQNFTDLPERRQVVFAKVHKAASSTVQNILLRFAMARNLSVLLPAHLNVLNEKTSRIDPRKIIAHTKGQPFDMLCNHLIFDENEIGKYVSKTAFRFAILREPMKQALSAVTFYTNLFPSAELLNGLRKHKPDPINGFLQHPEDFASAPSPAWSFVNNRMSVDLGFDLKNFESSKKDTTKKKAFLKKLEKQFDVILISDYFDESMVLLRRMLRWPLKDIIYLKVNTGKQIAKSSAWNKVPRINKTTIRRFRQWAAIDYDLYEYFLQIFKTKIKNEFLFQDEVKTFREIQQDVRNFCSNKTTIGDLRIQHNLWTKGFLVSKADCKLMALMEMDIINVAKSLQIDRYKSQLK